MEDFKSESSEGFWGDVMLDEDSVSGVFDFKRGRYVGEKRKFGLRESVYHSLLLFFGIVGIVLSILAAKFFRGYSLFTDYFPQKLIFSREIMRWLLFVSIGMFMSGLFYSIVRWLPVFISKAYISKGREVPDRVSTSLVFLINIGERVIILLTSLGLYFAVLYLFPPPMGISFPSLGDGDEETKESTFKNLFKAFKNGSAHETYAQYPWQVFASRLLLAISIGAFLFLLERILIVRIAIHFHVRTLQTEIEDNKKALEVIKALKRKVLGTSVHVKHDELGPALFNKLCKPGAEAVTSDDLAPYMTEADCLFFFNLIDINANGDLTREEFAISISNVYKQRSYLQKSIFDENQILQGLDSILRKIIVVACVVIGFALLDPQLSTQITTLGTTLISATILFHGTAAIAFQSIVFIVFSHPFDVGDKVIIEDDTLIVQEIGLWSCAFISTDDGKTVYLTNHNMRDMYIANLKRSPPMDEDFVIKVDPDTPKQKLDELEAKLKKFVVENKRDYVDTLIKTVKLMDRDRMELVIGLNHKSNFQNLELKNKRSKAFMLYLKECLDFVGIRVSPPR